MELGALLTWQVHAIARPESQLKRQGQRYSSMHHNLFEATAEAMKTDHFLGSENHKHWNTNGMEFTTKKQ